MGEDGGERGHPSAGASARAAARRARGHRALVYAPDAMASFPPDGRPSRAVPGKDRLPLKGVQVVCLSLLSTNSAARARYLVRRVRRRARGTRLLVGLWGHGADDFSPSEITAASGADQVVTTLLAAIAEIEAALREGRASPSPGAKRAPPSPAMQERG